MGFGKWEGRQEVAEQEEDAFSEYMRLWRSEDRVSRLTEIQEGLEMLVSETPSHSEAQALLAQLHLFAGRTEEAIASLENAISLNPTLGIALANLYQATGKEADMKEQALTVIERYRDQARVHPRDVEARALWAEAKMLLGDDVAAEAILQRGRLVRADPCYDALLVHLYEQRLTDPSADNVLQACEAILKLDPTHRKTYRRLVALGEEPTLSLRVRRLLESAWKESSTPSLELYQVLSGLACDERAWEKAITLCEEGLSRFPEAHALMNNLAWAFSHAEERIDLERAAELAEQAVQAAGDLPVRFEYAATRGEIRALTGRWREAIPDLETVLAQQPDRADAKATLIQCYEAIGRPELATSLRADQR